MGIEGVHPQVTPKIFIRKLQKSQRLSKEEKEKHP